MAVVENQLQGVVAHRLDCGDADIDLACLQDFLAGAVAADFC